MSSQDGLFIGIVNLSDGNVVVNNVPLGYREVRWFLIPQTDSYEINVIPSTSSTAVALPEGQILSTGTATCCCYLCGATNPVTITAHESMFLRVCHTVVSAVISPDGQPRCGE